MDAARCLGQEARRLLTSLRSGPPSIARGELAQDLMDLRDRLPHNISVEPFLHVVTDPRAAGPHTLVALQCLTRLMPVLDQKIDANRVTKAVLACKFEQTDAGADEAVELALADCLWSIVKHRPLETAVLMEAFTTLFVTRQTFLHAPALCLHLEDTLHNMVQQLLPPADETSLALLEYLVYQLLHTPLVGGEGLDEATRKAQATHDATRVCCFRLVRLSLELAWADGKDPQILLPLIQDDLCLSLLMTGQAIWAYHDATTNISPGFVSLEVLCEICATLSTLWNCLTLRSHLMAQFETILTGFYTRALVLLRQRRQANNSVSFNANLTFDAEVEIILESLVDLLCLHDHTKSIADSDGGALETMFAYYDCHLTRSDVAVGLMVELCRCCGGIVNEEGHVVLSPSNSGIFESTDEKVEEESSHAAEDPTTIRVEHPWRPVPPHLKELCAQAIMGGMRCLFKDDKASAATLLERSQRNTIMYRRGSESNEDDHTLRDVKSKKRLFRKAARLFNDKASRGIQFLADAGLLPDPVSPASVAAFLRNGTVVGLDKKAVGAYLGEAGKTPVAGKSIPCWERDWFHKDALEAYCSLFRFEDQSLLDGLRMFLAAFYLPGEAQQIDRILQAFADSCGRACEENCKLNLFSEDPKRASDAAYLLSFSIIMLNTDLHNANIREDRKMSLDDFVKNNTDYGRDITDKGKEFPRDFLETIYISIKEEQIRTEGEGADGAMTVERWKDVMRGSTDESSEDAGFAPSEHDAEDLTELVLEHVWKPIMSAIGAFWGVSRETKNIEHHAPENSGMLGVQGARLGMDMAFDMMDGVRRLGRLDIFRKIFTWVCDYTGLLDEYTADSVERTWIFSNSVEAQAAVIIAFKFAIEAGEDLSADAWKRIWTILLELRDLKLVPNGSKGLLTESDPDLLSKNARREWEMCLMKGDMDFDFSASARKKPNRPSSMLGAVGRALFGSVDAGALDDEEYALNVQVDGADRSLHGKDELVVWDEHAASDDEGEEATNGDQRDEQAGDTTIGTTFETQLIRESMNLSQRLDMPVTGLERVDESRRLQQSPRARVRGRIRRTCDLRSLIRESRFLNETGVRSMLTALVELISVATRTPLRPARNLDHSVSTPQRSSDIDRAESDSSTATPSFVPAAAYIPISPASEAFAEVLLCELALKNKDRLRALWTEILQDHYLSSLAGMLVNPPTEGAAPKKVDPGLEKRITGLLRISVCAIQREDMANDVLSAWKYVLPMTADQRESSPLRVLDRHVGEALWRMISNVDNLLNLDSEGWEGLTSLLNWCAGRGALRKPLPAFPRSGQSLPDDDPSLQVYRSIHLILNTREIDSTVPWSFLTSIQSLVAAGDRRHYSQLSIASLDMLSMIHEKGITEKADVFCTTPWRLVVETIARAAEQSSDPVSVRAR